WLATNIHPPIAHEITLASGKHVGLLRRQMMYFSNDKQWALIIDYRTNLKAEDSPELREEAEDVLHTFEKEIEASKVTHAVIRANFKPIRKYSLLYENKSFGFVFQKIGNSWQHIEAQKKL